MRIGIIAEGKEDQAVISNILRAFAIDKPKERLKYENKNNLSIEKLSSDFAKRANLKKFVLLNGILQDFVSSIEDKLQISRLVNN
jgi:hypothetical protein